MRDPVVVSSSPIVAGSEGLGNRQTPSDAAVVKVLQMRKANDTLAVSPVGIAVSHAGTDIASYSLNHVECVILGKQSVQERRKNHRNRTYLGGKIVFNNRNSSMDCLIRDMSLSGAKLIFTNSVTVPDLFELEMKKTCETRHIRVVWRRADEAGVQFLEAQPTAKVISLDIARNLKACDADRERLRRRVAELSIKD